MAKIYANSAGSILRFCDRSLEAVYPNPPTGPTPVEQTAFMLSLDDDTNASLLLDIKINFDAYRLVGSVLTKNGLAVTVAADGQDKAIRDGLVADLVTLRAAATNAATPVLTKAIIRALLWLYLERRQS